MHMMSQHGNKDPMTEILSAYPLHILIFFLLVQLLLSECNYYHDFPLQVAYWFINSAASCMLFLLQQRFSKDSHLDWGCVDWFLKIFTTMENSQIAASLQKHALFLIRQLNRQCRFESQQLEVLIVNKWSALLLSLFVHLLLIQSIVTFEIHIKKMQYLWVKTICLRTFIHGWKLLWVFEK